VPPPAWAASEQLAGKLSYDPARAEQLLEGAGWRREADGIRAREGKRLSFELLTNRGSGGNRLREQYGQLMIDYWRKLGVEGRLTLVDFQEVVTRLRRTHEFDTCLTSYALDVDPDQRLLWSTDAYKSGFNGGRFSSPALDKLMTEAVQTSEPSKRRSLYIQIQELLLDELPAIVIDYPQVAYGLNKRVRNVVPNPASLAFAAHQWWVADGK
jgi:peptide/nickel transport system substrate-binding protein